MKQTQETSGQHSLERYVAPHSKVVTVGPSHILCESGNGRMDVIDYGSGGFGDDEGDE